MEYTLNEINLMKEIIENEVCYVYNLEEGDN